MISANAKRAFPAPSRLSSDIAAAVPELLDIY